MIDLNEKQLNCVIADAPLIVVAAPGSGKTATIVERIKFNVEQRKIDPKRILALSFTVNAANELKDRSGYQVESRTIHSWCYRNLMRMGLKAKVASDYILQNMAGSKMPSMTNEIVRAVNFIRLGILDINDIGNTEFAQFVLKVKKEYEYYLRKNNMIDFTDMLSMMRDKLRDDGYRKYAQSFYDEIIVDEAQDLDTVQLEIVKLISNNYHNCVMVGDQDQSIYGFLGALADLESIALHNGINLMRLDNTYRFGNNVSEIACSVMRRGDRTTTIAKNKLHTDVTVIDDQSQIRDIIEDMVENNRYRQQDIAILSRTNTDAITVRMNVPYDVFSATADKIRPHIDYLTRIVDFCCRRDDLSLNKLLQSVKGIGQKTADKMTDGLKPEDINRIMDFGTIKALGIKRKSALDEFERVDREIMSMKAGYFVPGYNMFLKTPDRLRNVIDCMEGKKLEEVREIIFNEKMIGITSMTVHASKGMEFPVVIVNSAGGDLHMPVVDYSEEVRITYVAVTRAKNHLVVNRDSMYLDHLKRSDSLVQV